MGILMKTYILIEAPEGVEIDEPNMPEMGLGNVNDIPKLDVVCNLQKSMYATKQAPRRWNKKIHSVQADELGLRRPEWDPCLYVWHNDERVMS